MVSSRSLSHGFSMKSRAPRRIASTARFTEPHAVITTTGSDVVGRVDAAQQVEPLLARRRVARVVQVDEHDVVVALASSAVSTARGRVDGVDLVALALEQQPQRFEHVGLVVGDEDAGRRAVTRPSLGGVMVQPRRAGGRSRRRADTVDRRARRGQAPRRRGDRAAPTPAAQGARVARLRRREDGRVRA